MTLLNRFFNFILRHKYILGINYHRVENKKFNDAFSGLHTVKFELFKIQIMLIKFFFKIVSLEDIRKGNIKSKINFFISFDDVPTISKQAFNWLDKKNIPFVICPNIKLIEDGCSISDKFRFVKTQIKKEVIETKLQEFLNKEQISILKKYGLKKLYKSYKINQPKFEKIFQNNIFKDLENSFFNEVKKNNYLDWSDIKTISKKNTVVSHGLNHYDFFFLNYQEICSELELSKRIFEDNINSTIVAFALPYGAYSQHLGIMISEAANKVGYEQILWTGSQAIIYNKPYKNHTQHLFRINAPDNFITFLKSIILALKNTKLIFEEQNDLVYNYDKQNYNFDILENPSISKIVAFETIIRPYRKYSSNKKFIENIYINNPFRSNLPYAFGLSRNETLNSISYHLYKNYLINKKIYKIVEHSGWRKINSLGTTENVKLYLKVSKICKAFYHWRPSHFVSPGLKKSENYFMIFIKEYSFKIKKYKIKNIENIEVFNKCPINIDSFLDKFNRKFYLTLERSSKFYRWRFDNYPLGEGKYFINRKDNKISSLLVSQIYKNKALIVDLVGVDFDESIIMIKNFINYCNNNNIITIKFAISNKSLIEKINRTLNFNYLNFHSFIYIKNLIDENIIEKKILKQSDSFETYASGDVLIR